MTWGPRANCVCVQLLNHVRLVLIPWTVARQAPLPLEFPRKNTGMGSHFLLQEIFLTERSNLHLLHLLHWKADFLPLYYLGSPCQITIKVSKHILSMYFILISSWSRAKSWQISPNSGPSPCWTAVIPPVCQEPHLIFLKSTHPGDSGQWQQKETSWHVQKHGMWYQLQTHWTNFLFSQGILHMGLETNSRIFKSFLKV